MAEGDGRRAEAEGPRTQLRKLLRRAGQLVAELEYELDLDERLAAEYRRLIGPATRPKGKREMP